MKIKEASYVSTKKPTANKPEHHSLQNVFLSHDKKEKKDYNLPILNEQIPCKYIIANFADGLSNSMPI